MKYVEINFAAVLDSKVQFFKVNKQLYWDLDVNSSENCSDVIVIIHFIVLHGMQCYKHSNITWQSGSRKIIPKNMCCHNWLLEKLTLEVKLL